MATRLGETLAPGVPTPKRVRVAADGRAGTVQMVYYDRLHTGDSYDELTVELDDDGTVRGSAALFESIDDEDRGATFPNPPAIVIPFLDAAGNGVTINASDGNPPPAKDESMTVEQIQIKQAQAARKFEIAAQIRKWLDDAKSEWQGDDDWDDVETEIIELVTEDAE